MALEICLFVRARSLPEEQPFFSSETVKRFLNNEAKALLELDGAEVSQKASVMQAVWQATVKFASYYLKYFEIYSIDDHSFSSYDESRKVALSWWVARRLCKIPLGSFEASSQSDVGAWLKKKTGQILTTQNNSLWYKSLFKSQKNSSMSKYLIMDNPDKSFFMTFSVAALLNTVSHGNGKVGDGFKIPSLALSPVVKEQLFNRLSFSILLGFPQFNVADSGLLNLLPEVDFGHSINSFFHSYYGDSIEFLEELKQFALEFWSLLSEPEFFHDSELNTYGFGLEKIDDLVSNKEEYFVLVLLSCLYTNYYSTNEIPSQASVFKKVPDILRKLSLADGEYAWSCILRVAQLLSLLCVRKNCRNRGEWIKVFVSQLNNITDYSCSPIDLSAFVQQLMLIQIAEPETRVLEHLIEFHVSQPSLKGALAELYRTLDNIFSIIPIEYHSNARYIMSQLKSFNRVQDLAP